MPKIGLEEAVFSVQSYFIKQCGVKTQYYWEVLSAVENPAKGVYEIECREKCCFDVGPRRAHVVWVNSDTGAIEHCRRITEKDLA